MAQRNGSLICSAKVMSTPGSYFCEHYVEMNIDGTQTTYIYIDSSQVPDGTPGSFHFRLPVAIPNVVAADLVSCIFYYDNSATPPGLISVCSTALGPTTITSYKSAQVNGSTNPRSLGMSRAWRVLLNSNYALPGDGRKFAYFGNPRVEYTPINQSLLQDIDIQVLDSFGRPIETLYESEPTVLLVIALKIAAPAAI